jgi:hypothetical protein
MVALTVGKRAAVTAAWKEPFQADVMVKRMEDWKV